MTDNSSSNIFLPSPIACSLNSSLYPDSFKCFNELINTIIFTTLTITNLFFLLPLYILILWMGFRRWRNKSYVTGPASHSDVFTYCMVTMEIITVLGYVEYCFGIYTCSPRIMVAGYYLLYLAYPSQTFFHSLTCVERYLAVVHPITYVVLKKTQGARIRNISIGCGWLLCFGVLGVLALYFPVYPGIVFFPTFAFVFIVAFFCSFSVFCVLFRPGVGTDQSKQRAFRTIMVITGALVLRFCGQMLVILIKDQKAVSKTNRCMIIFIGGWLSVPSSLVLPLLFLHRTRMLPCSGGNLNHSEQ